MDEDLYKLLKRLEISAQGTLFDLPHRDSPMWKSMKLDDHEGWRFGALIEHLAWLQKKASSAATAAYMVGKE